MIEVQGVRHTFGSFKLELSLRVQRGQYLVILGPSGCGKSLLLGTVAGLYVPSRGAVQLHGRDVTAAPPEERGVGFVFQRASLFPHLTVAGNVEFGLRVRGVARAARRRRVDELVQTLGLAQLLERPVPALSGGEAQKVAIARALAPRPEVLLLDEPLSLVDHNARLELQDELRRIHAELELTTVHVTHNREEARAMGRRCAVMLGGRVVQLGSMEQVLQQPRCVFVARFFGLASEGSLPEAPGCSEVCLQGSGRCDAPWEADR